MGNLFGFLFLLLLEKETVQDRDEQDRRPGSNPMWWMERGKRGCI